MALQDSARQQSERPGSAGLFGRPGGGKGDFLVGAAIGSGMMAKAATRGGADFLVALNSARLRMMGAPSKSALLPLRDNNALVGSFGREEILPQATVPVFFGAAAHDPRMDVTALVVQIAGWGFSGVANSRSVARYHGHFREAIERAGLGIARECELFAQARRQGLSTLAFVSSLQDAETFAEVGVDAICIQFAGSAGEFGESAGARRLDEAMELARSIISRIRPGLSEMTYLVSGAPVVEPEQMLAVCDFAKADGYIGGSSVDRLPSEGSVENRMADFKNIAALRRRADDAERKLHKTRRTFGLVIDSPGMKEVSRRLDLLATSPLPVLITGESGTGKTLFTRKLHEHGPRASSPLTVISCEAEPEALATRLFGAAADPNGDSRRRIGWFEQLSRSSLVLDGVEAIDRSLQMHLVEAIESGSFRIVGGHDPQPLGVRLMFTSRHSARELLKSGLLEEALYLILRPREIALPPLRERLEDLPALAHQVINALGSTGRQPIRDIDHAVIRKLSEHYWPGNVRELISVLEQAIIHCRSGSITLRDIALAMAMRVDLVEPIRVTDEKSWILEALRTHRYRKGEAAAFLGLSRKTLYRKMKKLGVDVGS